MVTNRQIINLILFYVIVFVGFQHVQTQQHSYKQFTIRPKIRALHACRRLKIIKLTHNLRT